VLSKKMTTLYHLMVQQLSKQDHYDFGLRSVKSVLNSAGALKRSGTEDSNPNPHLDSNPSPNETPNHLRAISPVCLPYISLISPSYLAQIGHRGDG
jgi:dynein heavy chain